MKYIDAEKLKTEIQNLIDLGYDKLQGNLYYVISIVNSLQQEQPELPKTVEYYYHKGIYEGLSQGRADALKMLEEVMKRKADPVIVIKQQKQPEVELEKELNQWRHKHFKGKRDSNYSGEYLARESQLDIARHFYELGKNSK